MRVDTESGRVVMLSHLRVRRCEPNDLLVILPAGEEMRHLPAAFNNAGELTRETEESLIQLGLISVVFDDPTMAQLVDEGETAREISVIRQLLDLDRIEPGDMVADLGCGTGRHLLGLAERGIRLCGVDQSRAALLEAASEVSRRELDDRVELVCADIAQFSRHPRMAGAYAAMNSVRYVGTEARFRSHLDAVALSLKPEARYVVNMSFPHLPSSRERMTLRRTTLARWSCGGLDYEWAPGYTDAMMKISEDVVTICGDRGQVLTREVQLQFSPDFTHFEQMLREHDWVVETMTDALGEHLDPSDSEASDGGSRWLVLRYLGTTHLQRR